LIRLGETIKDGVLWLPGTDEWSEIVHHLSPFGRDKDGRLIWQTPAQREIAEAYRILDTYDPDSYHTIVGLSLGGAIAQIVAVLLLEQRGRYVNCYPIGGKRAPKGYIYYRAQSIRNAGDLITLLPPWRPKNPNELTRGAWSSLSAMHARFCRRSRY